MARVFSENSILHHLSHDITLCNRNAETAGVTEFREETIRRDGMDDEAGENLQDGLSPILYSMRLCGLYFKWPFDQTSSTTKSRNDRGNTTTRKSFEKFSAVYSISVLIILWANSARAFTAFTQGANLYQILMSFRWVQWFFRSAIQHTAYFIACRSGKLDRILCGLQVLPSTKGRSVRFNATKMAVFSWFMIAILVAFQTYSLQSVFNSKDDLNIVPIGTYIDVPDNTGFYQVIVFVPLVLSYCTVSLTLAMTFMLALIISSQFRYVDARLREAINRPGGISDDVIDDLRVHHQKLSRFVDGADTFLKLHNFAALMCPLANVIGIIFMILFPPNGSSLSISKILKYLFYIITDVAQLFLTATGGLLVNHYAHKIRERIHNIKTVGLRSTTVSKVNMFLDRTSGEPIGFTVLGIMVIDKNALITLLSLLITYFLLVVQFQTSSGTSCEMTCNCTCPMTSGSNSTAL